MCCKKITLTKRQFHILLFLEQQSSWVTTQVVAHHFNRSPKTIQNDIKQLKIILPQHWEICTEQGVGMRLSRPNTQTVYSRFQHNDDEMLFECIQLLINQPQKTLIHINEQLYTSSTVTVQLLNKTEQWLTNYRLQLMRSPYTIVGHEVDLRLILFEMKRLQSFSPLLRGDQHDLKDKLYEVLEKQCFMQLTPYGMETWITFILLSIQRIQVGNHVRHIERETVQLVMKRTIYDELQPAFHTIEQHFQLKLSTLERVFLSIVFTFSDFYFTFDWNDLLLIESKIGKKPLEEMQQFISFLERAFQLPFTQSEEWTHRLFTLYYINRLRNIHTTFTYQSLDPFITMSQHIEATIPYEKVHQLCKQWADEHSFRFSDYIVRTFALLIQQFIMLHVKVNVLVITIRPYCAGQYNFSLLNRELVGKATFHFMEMYEEDKIQPMITHFDYVITDVPLPTSYQCYPHFLINLLLSQHDVSRLHKEIQRLKLEKELAYHS